MRRNPGRPEERVVVFEATVLAADTTVSNQPETSLNPSRRSGCSRRFAAPRGRTIAYWSALRLHVPRATGTVPRVRRRLPFQLSRGLARGLLCPAGKEAGHDHGKEDGS